MKSKLVTLCICLCGIFQNIPIYLLFMATEDIVAGTLIHSSIIITLYAAGDLLSKVVSPMLIKLINLPACIVLSSFIWLASWLLIVVGDVQLRLAGAFGVGIMNGLLINIILSLLPLYQEIEKNASVYSSSTNATTFLTGFFYTSSTVWLCFPPRLAFAIFYPLTLLIVPFYAILNHGPLKKHQVQDGAQYSKIRSSEVDNRNSTCTTLFYDSLCFLYHVFPFISYLFLTSLFYRLGIVSTVTTLTFPSAPFRVRDHFQYYTLISDIGRIVGSADLMIASFFCPSKMELLRYLKVWMVVFASICNFVFLISASWYRYVPNVYIILLLCGTFGLMRGIAQTRVLVEVGNQFTSPRDKSLAMSTTQIGAGIGILVSGLLGFFLEEKLRLHCTNELLLGEYCLTRFKTSFGWIDNECG